MREDKEPRKTEAYTCPVCNKLLIGSYDKAKKHTDIPEYEPFPIGLTFSVGKEFYEIIYDNGKFSSDHGIEQYIESHILKDHNEDESRVFTKNSKSSKEIKKMFQCGIYSVLTKREFKGIQKRHPDRNLIRTTKKLEDLVKSK